MSFIEAIGIRFAMSAVSTVAVVVVLSLWTGVLEKITITKTEKKEEQKES